MKQSVTSMASMPSQSSLAESLASLTSEDRAAVLAGLTPDDAQRILYDWRVWGRPKQLPPPLPWRIWLILAGRGFGKTRTGAEWTRYKVESGQAGRIALVGPTAADVRDVMVEGESGILAISPPWNRPKYTPSVRRLVWPNGAIATTYSADEPERLRGPQHDAAWADELAAWRYAEAYDQLMFGLRLGNDPQCVATTTPKPVQIVRGLVARAKANPRDVVLTSGSTYDNAANLADAFMSQIVTRYEGTRMGRQEIYADVLDESEGALWKREWFDHRRVERAPRMRRIAVAIDPAASNTQASDETGIVVAGIGEDGRGYVLDDVSGRYSPNEWARTAILAWHAHRANVILAEKNNGGDMVLNTITMAAAEMQREGAIPNASVPTQTVWASQGKFARAEPVSALYEQGRVSHVGTFAALEDQCCTWEPNGGERSPDRLDALVWAMTELMVDDTGPAAAPDLSMTRVSPWRM